MALPEFATLAKEPRDLLLRSLPDDLSDTRIRSVRLVLAASVELETGMARWHGGLVAREVKAVLPSAWTWASNPAHGRTAILYSDIVARSVRCPDPFLRTEGAWVLRRLAPDGKRIELATLRRSGRRLRLLRAMGAEAANIHLGTPQAREAILANLAGRSADWLADAATTMIRDVTTRSVPGLIGTDGRARRQKRHPLAELLGIGGLAAGPTSMALPVVKSQPPWSAPPVPSVCPPMANRMRSAGPPVVAKMVLFAATTPSAPASSPARSAAPAARRMRPHGRTPPSGGAGRAVDGLVVGWGEGAAAAQQDRSTAAEVLVGEEAAAWAPVWARAERATPQVRRRPGRGVTGASPTRSARLGNWSSRGTPIGGSPSRSSAVRLIEECGFQRESMPGPTRPPNISSGTLGP